MFKSKNVHCKDLRQLLTVNFNYLIHFSKFSYLVQINLILHITMYNIEKFFIKFFTNCPFNDSLNCWMQLNLTNKLSYLQYCYVHDHTNASWNHQCIKLKSRHHLMQKRTDTDTATYNMHCNRL